MTICKYCNNIMMSEYESGRNSKSYTAFHTCTNCNALCDEKVTAYRGGRKEIRTRWYNPITKCIEEWENRYE